MNILEINTRYGITLRKLRRMKKDGILRVDATPEYWGCAVSDVKKGKLSARSIALAFKFRSKLDGLADFTSAQRKIIAEHFVRAGLPARDIPDKMLSVPVFGSAEGERKYLKQFIEAIKPLIPHCPVPYEYLAVRVLLSCETDHQINIVAHSLSRAFSHAKDDPEMKGWWFTEPSSYGKFRTFYCQPARCYDL